MLTSELVSLIVIRVSVPVVTLSVVAITYCCNSVCVCSTNKIVELAVSQNALCDDRRFVDERASGTSSSCIGRDGKQIKGMFLGLIKLKTRGQHLCDNNLYLVTPHDI